MQEVEDAIHAARGARIEGFRQCVEEVQRLGSDLIELKRYSTLVAGLAIDFKETPLKYYEDILAMFTEMGQELQNCSIGVKMAWDLWFELEAKVMSSSS